jgi:zinc transport system permease protein
MILSVVMGSFFCIAGLWTSYAINLASGAAIVILSAVSYLLVYIVVSVIMRVKRKNASTQ